MEALETSLPNSARMSCSLPSSLDVPKAPLGRPSSFPLALAAASPSLVRSEIRSRYDRLLYTSFLVPAAIAADPACLDATLTGTARP